jgi:predicted ATPase/DNA-binding SARP family transcriptional activator
MATEMTGRLQFGVLGPLEVWRDGEPVRLGGERQRALLALLLVQANELVRVETLVQELFGERQSVGAVHAVQVAVSRLRALLEKCDEHPVLETRPGGYVLSIAPEQLDAAQFERMLSDGRGLLAAGDAVSAAARLRAALGCWRGSPLADITGVELVQSEIRRLEELRMLAVMERIDADLAVSDGDQLIADLEPLIAAEPLQERLRGQLMLALYRVGRQTDALAVYPEVSGLLRDELGLEPGRALKELERSILQQDPALDPVAGVSATATVGYLPVPATAFLGRERELGALTALLSKADTRLLTLTGAGGSGKTRLALRVARASAQDYRDGVWFIAFAEITNPQLIAPTICQSLGLAEQPGITPTQRLSEWLRSRSLLLLLDNLEQLAPHTAILGELLATCPHLRLLVTSREPLHLAGEQQYEVPVLQPEDAVELFTARAHAVAPGLIIDPEIARQICERLDRLPLAIELSAPRTKTLSPAEILIRLEQRLPVLAVGPRDAPRRQHTLQATIDWSYQLLTEHEQQLFARIGVFAGGFTLPAAESVCQADLDTLQALTDRSLIKAQDGRYSMLETIREYALELFDSSDERDEIRARHARWYFALGVGDGDGPRDGTDDLIRLRQDAANVGRALAWALDHEIAAALPLADALFIPWLGAGRIRELERWYERALADPTALSPGDRAKALAGLGSALVFLERIDQARTALIEALTLYRDAGDERGQTLVLLRLGAAEFIAGAPESALAWAEQALPIYERLGDTLGIARTLHHIAEALRDLGDLRRSAELFARSIEIRRANGLGSGAATVHSLGDLYLDAGDTPTAERYYREALALGLQEGDVRLGAYCLAGLACVAARNEDATAAGRLWTLAERLEHEIGFRMVAAERVRYERHLTPPLTNTDEYRAGIADAANIDPLTAAGEIVNP